MPVYSLHTLFTILAAVFLLADFADAQTTSRPGSSARSNASTSGTGTARSSVSSSNSGSRSSTGQRQYRSNTELGDAVISIDPETRTLIIVTDEDTHREMATVIKTLDKPKPQVLIKVVFLEVTYNKDLDVGIEGGYTFHNKSAVPASTGTLNTHTTTTTTSGGTTTTNVTTTGNPVGTTGTGVGFNGTSGTTGNTVVTNDLTSVLGTAAKIGETAALSSIFGAPATGSFVKFVSDDWNATLHALASKGKVEVLSRPSIMARNNQEAVIVVGQEVPFITNSRTTDTGQTLNTIQYDNVGIILRVTPFITSEGTVEMIVAPEISNINNNVTVPIGNNTNAITIDKRSAETVVVTPHAQTVVIGGLMSTHREETISKVPILGDIPVIGFPFRRTQRTDVKTELLIFLTPYIVNDANGIATATNGEMAKSELSGTAFTKQDFEKYLDDLPMPSQDAKAQGTTAAQTKKATLLAKPKKTP